MRCNLLAPLLGAALMGVGGCGTMENLVTKEKSGPAIYGGVAADFKACQDILVEEPLEGLHPGVRPLFSHSKGVRFCCRMIDMPLSTVGDTLTIPFALRGGAKEPAAEQDEAEESDE